MMRAQMSTAAWNTGARTAGIVFVILLGLMALGTAVVRLVTHYSIYSSVVIVVLVFLFASIAFFLVNRLRDGSARGDLVLECGVRPMRWLFIVNACVFFLVIMIGDWDAQVGHSLLLRITLACSFAAVYLLEAFGHLQLYTNGIWLYNRLLPWNRINSYHWEGTTLMLEFRGLFQLTWNSALPFPAEVKDAVEAILHQQLAPEAHG